MDELIRQWFRVRENFEFHKNFRVIGGEDYLTLLGIGDCHVEMCIIEELLMECIPCS